LVNVFLRHTSASLLIFENADLSARHDLEKFFERLVPEGEGYFSHTVEGPDDMPSHIRMALTRTSESIPIAAGQLRLGTWQGLFLYEHRAVSAERSIVVSVIGTTNR
jgi:secondary thiamine-phosphate synthase enzyme